MCYCDEVPITLHIDRVGCILYIPSNHPVCSHCLYSNVLTIAMRLPLHRYPSCAVLHSQDNRETLHSIIVVLGYPLQFTVLNLPQISLEKKQ